jgi:hypothetical protein
MFMLTLKLRSQLMPRPSLPPEAYVAYPLRGSRTTSGLLFEAREADGLAVSIIPSTHTDGWLGWRAKVDPVAGVTAIFVFREHPVTVATLIHSVANDSHLIILFASITLEHNES